MYRLVSKKIMIIYLKFIARKKKRIRGKEEEEVGNFQRISILVSAGQNAFLSIFLYSSVKASSISPQFSSVFCDLCNSVIILINLRRL